MDQTLSSIRASIFPSRTAFEKTFVIALDLIGISHREVRDGSIKGVGLAEVAADQGWFAGTGVGARSVPPHQSAKMTILAGLKFDVELELHVPELADVEMPAVAVLRPAQEDVAGRLHEPVPLHDPLPWFEWTLGPA